MVDHDGRSGLLGPELILVAQLHVDPPGIEHGQNFVLIGQIRAGRITEGVPRTAIFLFDQITDGARVLGAETQLGADPLVHELGQPLRPFGIKTMPIEVLLVLITVKEFTGMVRGALPHRDQLEGHHITLTASGRTEIVGDAEPVSRRLLREPEAAQFGVALRAFVDDQLLALGGAGKIAVDRLRHQNRIGVAGGDQAVQDGIDFGAQIALVTLFVHFAALESPLEPVERGTVHIGQHRAQRHLLQAAGAPEGRFGYHIVVSRHGHLRRHN